MPVELKVVEPDLRDLDKAILKEAAGCAYDDQKAKDYELDYKYCVLMLNALAKKMLGIFGVSIGNDPRRAGQLGFSNERDFNEERKGIVSNDSFTHESKKARLDQLAHEETFANDLASKQDPAAWSAVIKLQNVLFRRACALERAGLVKTNVDNMVAEEFAMREREQTGQDPKVPCEGSVEITAKGLSCISAQRWPRVKSKQRSNAERFDYDVEVPT